jgi:hypothetical protein
MKHANAASKCWISVGCELAVSNGAWFVFWPASKERLCLACSYPVHSFILSGTRKFAQAYMMARELGSGAFSVVKLGVNLVSLTVFLVRTWMWFSSQFLRCACTGNRAEDSGESRVEKEIV